VDHLAELRLTLHEAKAQVRPVTEGIPFLGFVVYPDHRRLKRRNGVNFHRKLSNLVALHQAGLISRDMLERSLRGWLNHARYGDTWGLRRSILQGVRL
jgi:hypothetical protein